MQIILMSPGFHLVLAHETNIKCYYDTIIPLNDTDPSPALQVEQT